MQTSTGGFGSEKPFSQYVILRSNSFELGMGVAVDGGLVYGCTQSFQVESAVTGGPFFPNEALRCEATRGEGSRRRRKADSRQAGCATPRRIKPACDARKGVVGPVEEPASESTGHLMRNRHPRGWKKSSASLVERRRSGPGKTSSRHGGGVEAVSANLSESDHVHRERHAPVSRRIATGASEAGRRVQGKAQQAPACEDGPPKRSSRVVKRADLQS